jgi:hypothetical protein
MSFSGDWARSFFGPLWGKAVTFVLDERKSNVQFARTIVSLANHSEETCSILDLDALYSSNADAIFSEPAGSGTSRILLPPPGSEVELEFPRLFEAQQRIIIVDSLNSLYHLLSQDDTRSRGRKFAFAVESLSYLARANSKAAVLTMYRREGFTRQGRGRSISGLSDVTATVEVRADELMVRSERGKAWTGGRFSTRIP